MFLLVVVCVLLCKARFNQEGPLSKSANYLQFIFFLFLSFLIEEFSCYNDFWYNINSRKVIL